MLKLTAFIFLSLYLLSCGDANSRYSGNKEAGAAERNTTETAFSITADTATPLKQKTMNQYYPFELNEFDGQYHISAPIESGDLYPKYYDFFQKHGYEGNGYCWEGHITQILEKLDKELLSHIEFDPEAGGFYAYADSKENQVRFAKLLSPIFSDLPKLEEWVLKADRSRIDD